MSNGASAHQAADLAQKLEELRAERRRRDELLLAYGIVERSKFARARALLVGGGTRAGGGSNVSVAELPANAGDVEALLAELREAQASRLDLLDLIDAERNHGEAADSYARWLRGHELRESDVARLAQVAPLLPYAPTISIVMAVYETRPAYLRAAIESVLAQVYPHWQLCIADDGSPSPHVREILAEFAARDGRIDVVRRTENGGVSVATNTALGLARGEFAGFLDHDDLLTRDALYEVALLLNRHRDADMIYSDEDKVDDSGTLREPYFKPDWCPDSLLSRMYTSHFSVYRTTLVQQVDGLRAGFEGSQDHDLALRIVERTNAIYHIPKILYHWRIHPNSTASASAAKPYAAAAGRKAVQEALERRAEPGTVVARDDVPGVYVVRYLIRQTQLVSIIIPTRDHGEDVDRCLASIFTRATYPNFEVVIVDNGSAERSSLDVFARWSKRERRVRVVRYDQPFNFSKLNNFGADHSSGEYLLLLNNDTEIVTRDWIEALVEQAQRPSIGVVGGLLLYPDDTIQHAGVILGLGGIAGHAFKHLGKDEPGYFATAKAVNNVSAVTAACAMLRRSVFEEVGRFDESLAVSFNDVDLCLKVLAAGYRNVYLPHVQLYHFESKSRGTEPSPEDQRRFAAEILEMEKRWRIRDVADPYYSIHLTLDAPAYAIRA